LDQQVNLFNDVPELFTNKVVKRGEKVGLVSERTHWTTERNAFLRKAYLFARGVYESNVYNKWDYYFWTARYYWFLKYENESFALRRLERFWYSDGAKAF